MLKSILFIAAVIISFGTLVHAADPPISGMHNIIGRFGEGYDTSIAQDERSRINKEAIEAAVAYGKDLKNPDKKKEFDRTQAAVKALRERDKAAGRKDADAVVSKVSPEDWEKLVNEHKKSPCLENSTLECLLAEAKKLAPHSQLAAEKSHYRGDRTYEMIIADGNAKLAEEMLPKVSVDNRQLRMQLLFTAGQYDEAIKLLEELQETTAKGGDYGATWALLKRGDLDKALEVAKKTITWSYIDPTLKKGHSRIVSGECVGNIVTIYPRPIAVLSNAYTEKKEYDKAYEAVGLIKQYKDNNYNGHGYSNCTSKFTKWAYTDAMYKLGSLLAKNGQQERAKAIYQELENNAKIFRIDLFSLAKEMSDSGFKNEAINNIKTANLPEPSMYDSAHMFYSQVARQETDPTALAYSAIGEYQLAIDRAVSLTTHDIKINTLFRIARASSPSGEARPISPALSHIPPLLGKRHRPVDSVLDYLDFADLLFESGQTEQSKKALKDGLALYETVRSPHLYERLPIGGRVALLHAKYGDYAALAAWVDNPDNDIDYNSTAGSTFSSIMAAFAAKNDWVTFDNFLLEQGSRFKKKGGGSFDTPFVIREQLSTLLLQKKQYDRYLRVTSLMDSPQEQNGKIRNLLIASFMPGQTMSAELKSALWEENLRACYFGKDPTASERLARCYMAIAEGIEWQKNYSTNAGNVRLGPPK